MLEAMALVVRVDVARYLKRNLDVGDRERVAKGQPKGLTPIFGSKKTSMFLTNTQSSFGSVVLDGVLVPVYIVKEAA